MKKEAMENAITEYVETAIYRAYAPLYNSMQGRLDAYVAYKQAEALCLTWNKTHHNNLISLRDTVLKAKKNQFINAVVADQSYFEIIDKIESILIETAGK